MTTPTVRRRWPIVATAAVLVGGALGATAVALVGSAQRRDDRKAYLRYESAVLPIVREGGRVVQQEMKPSIRELGGNEITQKTAVDRAAGWRAVFTRIGADLIALDPPGFLGDIGRRWSIAVDGYLKIPDLFDQAAKQTGSARAALLAQAAAAGDSADKLFDDAAGVLQYHRRRLGLGSTSQLPDPAATAH